MKIKIIIAAISVLLLIAVAWASYTFIQIKKTAKEEPPNDIPYIIILGAKVNGEKMSKALSERAKVGLEYLRENKKSKVIVTGGQGPDEKITEAEALRRYMMDNGISKDRILMEDTSVSTYENIKFAKKLYSIDEAVIVSSDFHLYRAIQLATAQGIKAYPLAADTPKVVKMKLYARELLAILKWKIIGD
ncbi:YdcF family protein [Heyndrickxia vini]|uniref:YdcF family protein n=1 Tax=Heyndrickxia vini TaxID=1476025 RepID=A0ABX7E648_9BACI|nr:YdcF family protein [Heyndrickxia vini]QQZ11229.1 YdcF family protein [Heyndrickxia vini]